MIKAIFFDFDGVILESVNIKGNVFKKLFEDYPEHLDEIMAYHLENGGVSRYDKFEYYYKNLLKKPLSSEEKQILANRFSELVMTEILKCPFVPGAEEFIRTHYKSRDLYIISGTPDAEIKEIAKARHLEKYFKGIFGSPTSKTDISNNILAKNNYQKNEVMFIGDAMSDYNAARNAEIIYIGRDNPEAPVFYPTKPEQSVFSLEEIII